MSGRASIAILLAGLTLAAGGCGGSDDEGTTTTAEPATTAAAEDTRLSAASWATYVAAGTKARAVNQAAIKTFRACRDEILTDASDQAKQCLGTSTSKVVTQGRELIATLDGFEGEVGGACATATTNYAGSVKLYIASVNAIGVTVEGGNVASSQTAIDNALEGLTAARTAATDFEEACKPT